VDIAPSHGHDRPTMSDDEKREPKPNPVDDLKQGLGLLLRAAKGAASALPTDKIEDAVKDGAKEVTRAFETVATEIDKLVTKATTSGAPGEGRPEPPEPTTAAGVAQAKEQHDAEVQSTGAPAERRVDDAYAPEPPKGPRVG